MSERGRNVMPWPTSSVATLLVTWHERFVDSRACFAVQSHKGPLEQQPWLQANPHIHRHIHHGIWRTCPRAVPRQHMRGMNYCFSDRGTGNFNSRLEVLIVPFLGSVAEADVSHCRIFLALL